MINKSYSLSLSLSLSLESRFNQFFVDKIEHIRAELPLLNNLYRPILLVQLWILFYQHVLLLLKTLPWLYY